MARRTIPERLRWVVEALAIDAGDHVLEIGCGRGDAVTLICERLADGTITAVDRSAVAIDAARQANSEHVRSGTAVFLHADLGAAEFDGAAFDTAFAVNVNLFWVRRATRELAVIDRSLKGDGALHLFYGYGKPGTGRSGEIVDKLRVTLSDGGFVVGNVVMPSAASSHMLQVTARRTVLS